MLFHPAILALLLGSILTSSMIAYSSYYGVQILKRWDIRSGSELQLSLERRTYLISTMMTYAMGFQLLSLFLFIYTADRLAPLLVGAMCAAGTLHANPWGYPAMILKIVNFLLAGLWLVVNHTDNRAYDYPLTRKKYLLLILIAPFILAEAIVQGSYFLGIHPNIITSCCGTLFSSEIQGGAGGLVALPRSSVQVPFYSSLLITFASGIYFYRKGGAAYLFSLASVATFVVSVIALISFFSLYFYELPTHHCPFCILQKEYGYVGYPIYLAILGGAVWGLGAGVIEPFREIGSLRDVLPRIQRRLTLASLLSFAVFVVVVLCGQIFSNLKL